MPRLISLLTLLMVATFALPGWGEDKKERKPCIVIVSEGNDPKAESLEKQLAGNKLLKAFFDQPGIKEKVEVRALRPADLKDEKLYLAPAAKGRFDLVIFDRCTVPNEAALPKANTYFIHDVPPPFKKSELRPLKNVEIKNGYKDHLLMKYCVSLDEITFTEAFRFEKLPAPRNRLLETGPTKDGAKEDADTAVLFLLERGKYRDLIQTFPLVNDKNETTTNWYKKVCFPLFLDNVLHELGNLQAAAEGQNKKDPE